MIKSIFNRLNLIITNTLKHHYVIIFTFFKSLDKIEIKIIAYRKKLCSYRRQFINNKMSLILWLHVLRHSFLLHWLIQWSSSCVW